jgi:hypothetical protein
MRQMIVMLGLAAAGGCTAALADEPKQSNIDPKADELLRKMSNSLASTKELRFDADHTLEAVTKSGEKLQFVAKSRVSVQRPNKLRSDRIGAIADATLYYDGKTLTIFGKKLGMYASSPAPATLDAAIDFARDTLGLEAPAADLLYTDAYKGLMEDVVSGTYIGDEPIDDRKCHHLAFRERDTDWQIWIEDSPHALPCRYVITSRNITGAPEFSVSFSNWNLAPKLDPKEFVFDPPSNATKINFLPRNKEKKEQTASRRSKP